MDVADQDYLKKRQALLQDSLRDQRIHHWISSQYDFALSEFESETHPQDIPPSRADSPLLGFPDGVATSACGSLLEDAPCPSYDPLFFSDPSQDSLSTADQEFEDGERERALKFLIEEMNLVFPCTNGGKRHTAEPQCEAPESREKVNIHAFLKIFWHNVDNILPPKSLPPLPPRTPPSTPYSSPTQSRRPSHSHTLQHTSSRTRLTRLPSISATLGSPNPVLQVEDVLYVDNEVDTPTPTATPVPTSTRARAPAPLNLFSKFEAQRTMPPSPTTTTNASTPALSPTSPQPLSYPQPQQLPHSRSTSFPESLFTESSGPASPTSSAYLTPDSNWTVPAVVTSSGADKGAARADKRHHAFPSRDRDHDKLCVPPSGSRWSLTSSIPDEEAEFAPSVAQKSPSKRKRLFSLISMLSPSAKEAKENRPVLIQPRTTPPSPASSSIYLADVNTSSTLNNFGLATGDPNYNPYYDHSTSDSSSLSNKKSSLTSLGYASRSFAKPKKRTLVVGGVKENDARTFNAVRRWCEVNLSH